VCADVRSVGSSDRVPLLSALFDFLCLYSPYREERVASCGTVVLNRRAAVSQRLRTTEILVIIFQSQMALCKRQQQEVTGSVQSGRSQNYGREKKLGTSQPFAGDAEDWGTLSDQACVVHPLFILN
jgi:hypothetical protein